MHNMSLNWHSVVRWCVTVGSRDASGAIARDAAYDKASSSAPTVAVVRETKCSQQPTAPPETHNTLNLVVEDMMQKPWQDNDPQVHHQIRSTMRNTLTSPPDAFLIVTVLKFAILYADLRSGVYLHQARATADSTDCIIVVIWLSVYRRNSFGHRYHS
jgi:hypothetical protein